MGYQIYKVGKRWAGYGVPAICEARQCNKEIDRGMAHACGEEPFSEFGCDRYFCSRHVKYIGFYEGEICKHEQDIDGGCVCEMVLVCNRCAIGKDPYPYKPETKEWLQHLLNDPSWQEWRTKNPKEVEQYAKEFNKT